MSKKRKAMELSSSSSSSLYLLAEECCRVKILSFIPTNVREYAKCGVSKKVVKLVCTSALYIINELTFDIFYKEVYYVPDQGMSDQVDLSSLIEEVNKNEKYKELAKSLGEKHNIKNDDDKILLTAQYLQTIIYLIDESVVECQRDGGSYIGYMFYCCNAAFTPPKFDYPLKHKKLIHLIENTPIVHLYIWWKNLLSDETKVTEVRTLPSVSLPSDGNTNSVWMGKSDDEDQPNALFQSLPLRRNIVFMSDIMEAVHDLASDEKEESKWKNDLDNMKHGDQLRISSYRGCGTFILDQAAKHWNIKNLPNEVLAGVLVGTMSEYGCIIPFNFGDLNVAAELFERIYYTNYILVDPCRMIGDTQLVKDAVKKVLDGDTNSGHDEVDWADSEDIKLQCFPQDYIAVFNSFMSCVWGNKWDILQVYDRNKPWIHDEMALHYRIFCYIYDTSYNEINSNK